MDPELNSLEADFNVRLDQWISKQGTLFQIKHAKGINSLFPKLCVLAFKLLILGLICLTIFWFYLSSRPASVGYRDMVQGNVQNWFQASEAKVKSMRRVDKGIIDGEMKISHIELKASEQTFFQDWYDMEVEEDKTGRQMLVENKKHFSVSGIVLSPFGITDGMFSSGWKARDIDISTLTCMLKIGADTDDQALKSYQQIFKKSSNLAAHNITIREANLKWGYGPDKGEIKGASIKAQYANNVWSLEIERGEFSHGWLKNAAIEKMIVVCYKDGKVEINSAKLHVDGGSIDFSAEIAVKAKPEVTGEYSFAGIDVLRLVGKEYEKWFNGKIKGDGVISGNMNTRDGLKVVTTVSLNNARSKVVASTTKANDDKATAEELAKAKEDSRIFLRGSFSLFQDVLQFRDTVHSYSLLAFDTGSFEVTQQGYNTSFKIPDMRVGSFLIVEGDFTYNSVKASEVEEADGINSAGEPKKELESIEANGLHFESDEERVNRFSGKLRLGFLPEVFEKYPEILGVYPMDTKTARVWIPLKMTGGLNDISSEIAEELDKIIQEEEAKRE
mgnify:CR=1 FL=1